MKKYTFSNLFLQDSTSIIICSIKHFNCCNVLDLWKLQKPVKKYSLSIIVLLKLDCFNKLFKEYQKSCKFSTNSLAFAKLYLGQQNNSFSQCTEVRMASFRWIHYYGSNKSTGKETDKTHLCVLVHDRWHRYVSKIY